MPPSKPAAPSASLSVLDGVAMIVGVVVGVGIFKTPSLVAANVGSEAAFIGVWVLGGVITLVGALCYAELGSAHPDAGGEYHFLTRAYGRPVGLLFAWARGTVIQTGAIAAVGFVYGDYASNLVPLGPYSSAIHAAIALVVLTSINLIGTLESKRTQVLLTSLTILALLTIMIAGFTRGSAAPAAAASATDAAARRAGARHGVRAAHLWRVERGGLPHRRAEGRTPHHRPDPALRHGDRDGGLYPRQSRLSQRLRARRVCAAATRSERT